MKRLISTIIAIAFISVAISPIQTYATDNYVIDEQSHFIDETNPSEEDPAQYQEEDPAQYQKEDLVQYQHENPTQYTNNTPGQNIVIQEKSGPEESGFVSEPQNNTESIASTSQDFAQSTTITATVGKYMISATGKIPENAILSAHRIYNTSELEQIIGDEKYSIYVAFDIEILVDGEAWQPVDYNETVTVSVTNIEILNSEELKVYRIEDEVLENPDDAPADAITELGATMNIEGNIEVETEHFTTYTFGETTITVDGTAAYFGIELAHKIIYNISGSGVNTNTTIKHIEWSDTDISTNAGAFKVSDEHLTSSGSGYVFVDTGVPIYAYADNDTLWLYSSASKVYLNEYSSEMFYSLKALEDINFLTDSRIDTSLVTNMTNMFDSCSSLTTLDLSRFNTSNVTRMFGMFNRCSSLTTLDISNFNTSNVTNMSSMFNNCKSLTALNLNNFDTKNVTSMRYMFAWCSSLTSLAVDGFNTENVTDMNSMFSYCSSLTNLNVSGFKTANVTDMGSMFYKCSKLTSLDVDGFKTANVTDMSSMFNDCSSLTNLDVSGFKTANVTKMGYMFKNCSKLTSLNVSGFDTTNVTNMNSMFDSCSKLTSLNVNGFNTTNVTSMYHMFFSCSSLTSLDVSGFHTNNVTSMEGMFYGCSKLAEINLNNFHTTKLTTMNSMFSYCSSLITLDLSSFNTSNVTSMTELFYNCPKLTNINLSSFNTSNVTTMYCMFQGCSSLTGLDVSGFDTSNVITMYYMFYGCSSLTSLNLSSFSFAKVTKNTNMLGGCTGLITVVAPATIASSQVFALPTVKYEPTWYIDDNHDDIADTETSYTLIAAATNTVHTYVLGSKPGFIYGLHAEFISGYKFNAILTDSFSAAQSIMWVDDPWDNYQDDINVSQEHYWPIYMRMNGTTLELYTSASDISCSSVGNMFKDMSNLKTVEIFTDKIGTINTQYINGLFENCTSLTTADLSHFVLTGYCSCTDVFKNCTALTTVKTPMTLPSESDALVLPQIANTSWYLDNNNDNVADSPDKYKEIIRPIVDTVYIYVRSDKEGFQIPEFATTLLPGAEVNVLLKNLANSSTDATTVTTDNSIKTIKVIDKPFTSDVILTDSTQLPVYARLYSVMDYDNIAAQKISHTENISEDGSIKTIVHAEDDIEEQTYKDELNTKNIVSIPGSVQLHVILRYGTEEDYDWLYVCSGNYAEEYVDPYDSSLIGQYTGSPDAPDDSTSSYPYHTVEFDVPGDTVTFFFSSDSSNGAYGYYAIVQGYAPTVYNDIVEVYSVANKIVANEDSSSMFANMENLSNIENFNVDFSQTVNTSSMFYNCKAFKTLDLARFNAGGATYATSMFEGCSGLTSITLPDNLTTIADSMFSRCDALSTVIGGANITSIGTHAFDLETAGIKKYLDLTDYASLTNICWRNYDWAGDSRTIMRYEISIPATLNLTNQNAANIDIIKYLTDDDLTITVPNTITLTHTVQDTAKLMYKLDTNQADNALISLPDLTQESVIYSESDWTGNTKHSSYSIPYTQTDNVNATASGEYRGDIAITFSRVSNNVPQG